MKIVTWNVNSLKTRLTQVKNLIIDYDLDIIALQELKLSSEFFPLDFFLDLGYNCAVNGQKAYNGVALISKFPIFDIVYNIPNFSDDQKRVISATINDIKIVNVYCVNGQSLDSEKFQYKQIWFKNLIQYLASLLFQFRKVIILGDFNIAPEDIDVYDIEKWQDSILSSKIERQIYQYILNLGLVDVIRRMHSNDKIYTWWDYRMNSFKRNLGLRIDHILVSNCLFPKVKSCYIAKEIRALERPSDHAPLWIDIA